jgi:hypothetical protein
MLRSFQRLDFDATVCLPGGFRDRNIQRPLTKICPKSAAELLVLDDVPFLFVRLSTDIGQIQRSKFWFCHGGM